MQSNGGHRVGNLNLLIYPLANENTGVQIFRDVEIGNNAVDSQVSFQDNVEVPGFSAAQGYDQVTGWGTVDISNFVSAIIGGMLPTPTATPTRTQRRP